MARFFLFLLLFGLNCLRAQVQVAHTRVENLNSPIGLDATQPRFGWQLQSERQNVLQTAYEIRVAHSRADLVSGKYSFRSTL